MASQSRNTGILQGSTASPEQTGPGHPLLETHADLEGLLDPTMPKAHLGTRVENLMRHTCIMRYTHTHTVRYTNILWDTQHEMHTHHETHTYTYTA